MAETHSTHTNRPRTNRAQHDKSKRRNLRNCVTGFRATWLIHAYSMAPGRYARVFDWSRWTIFLMELIVLRLENKRSDELFGPSDLPEWSLIPWNGVRWAKHKSFVSFGWTYKWIINLVRRKEFVDVINQDWSMF